MGIRLGATQCCVCVVQCGIDDDLLHQWTCFPCGGGGGGVDVGGECNASSNGAAAVLVFKLEHVHDVDGGLAL